MRNTRQRGKKLLSILLSAVMVTQMYAMPVQSAFAADGADEQQASTVEARAGDESTPDDDSQNADDQAVVEPAPSTDDQQGDAAPAEEQKSDEPADEQQGEKPESKAPQAAPADEAPSAATEPTPQNAAPSAKESGEYNGDADHKEATRGISVTVYKDKDCSQELGGEAVSGDTPLYGKVNIDFATEEQPALAQPNVKYTFPKNVSFSDQSTQTLYDGNNQVAGTWYIKDGVAYLHYNEDWLRKEHSNVSAHVNFQFNLNSNETGDDKQVTVNFPGTATSTVINTKDGNVSGNKFGTDFNNEWSAPKFDASDNSYTWTVKVSPSTTATDLKIEDVIGSNLDFVSDSFKLVDKSGHPVAGKCDVNLDGQKATISLGTLSKGDNYVQYKTTVKQSALDSLKDGEEISGVGNTATWKWGSKGENNGTSGPKDPEKVKYQMVQKSADSDSTNDNIKWTVKLNSGSIKADMSGYKFSDKLSDGQKFKAGTSYVVTDASGKQVATGTVDPNSDELNFTLPASAGKQELTVTYVTAMNDTSSTKPVSNTTQVTPPNGEGVPGKADASYRPTDDRTYVTKRLVDSSTVETDGKASWKSVIKFSAMDTDTVASKVLFSDRIDKNGGSFEHMKFSNIVLKVVGSDAVLTRGADYTVEGGDYSSFTVRFLGSETMKSLIGQNDVVVTYDTTCSGANATYTNTSTVKIDNVDKGSATDSYVINKDLVPAVSKNSSGEAQWKADYTWPDGTKGAWITDWEVHVNCDEPNWTHRGAADLKGDDVVVKDTLGDDMTYVAGSSRYWLIGNESEGYKKFGDWPKLQAEPTDSNGMAVFTIPTKRAVNQDGSWRGYIKLTYQTATKQSAVDAGGSKELTNTAEASSGSTSFPAGTGKVTINNKVLDKQAVRATDNSHVTYIIKVNPNAQKLTTSGSLTLTDTMNAGASFTTGTLKVKDASGKEVTEGVSYSLKNQPNDDGSTSTVLTITVPDAQALTITYDVAPQGALNTKVWIENDVYMQGFSSAKASHGQNWVVQKSNAGTDATSYGITVVKTDETGKEALEGAEFTLYKVDLDKSTPDNIVRSKVDTVGDNPKATDKSGTAKFGDKEHPLDAATLYCYEETKAPAGYKITNTAPTYVMFSGSSDQAKADYAAAFKKAQQLGIKPNSGTAYNVFDEKATEPTGSATLNVAKQVNGSDPAADQSFEFSIAGNDDASKAKIPENATATTTGAKVASFGSINVAKEDIGQTYTYTIHETSPAPNDGNVWTMASDVTATVKVGTPTDDAPTVIPVTVEYSNANTDGNAALFNNTWAKPGSASTTLSVHKSVDAAAGANVSADEEFTFELYKADAQGNKTDEKLGDAISVKKDGTAKFGELTFGADGTYNYVIHETGHDGNGWTPAADVKAQIVVKKSDDGKLFVVDSVTYDGKRADCANFVDKYEAAKASASLAARKSLEGAELEAGQFSFQLKAKGGEVLQTKPNAAEGGVAFDAIEYTAPGTYEYEISEAKGSELGVTYDGATHTAEVVVTDDGQGQLHAAVTYDGGGADAPEFKNTYTQATGEFQLGLLKTVNGQAPRAGESFEFSATAEGENAADAPKLADATTGADGSAAFGVAGLADKDAGRTYTYRIHEVTDLGYGWTAAPDVVATVAVSGKTADNKLIADVTYRQDAADAQAYEGVAQFDNKYSTSTSATVSVHKDVEGVTDAVRGKEFTFGLYGSDEQGNKAGDAIATCTAKAGETASFGALSYSTADAGKTFTYWIHEEGQDGDGWALDKDTKVTVTVAENADRSLAAAVSYDRKADGADAAEFTNAYAADGSATVMVKKTVNGEAPEQNKQFTFQLKDEAGNVLSEATTTGNAAAQFAPIKYTLADAGKTFSYTVHESTPAAAGYTNAADKAVTVEVSADNGTGKLKTTVAYDGQGEEDQASATMNNTYVAASGEFQLGLVKTVNGGAPLPGESFEFSATSADEGAPALANAAIGADGSAAFEAAKLSDKDLGKIYTYTIHEVTDLGDGWAKAADVTAEVKVPAERDAEGKVVPTVTYNGDAKLTAAKFDNSYQAKPASASLSVDKTVNGAKNDAVKNEFTFGLSVVTDGAPLPAAGGDAATVKGTSGASFGQISFDKAGEYKYAITETSDLGRGWTNDAAATATVTVGYAQNGRDLVVEGIKYSRATADGSAAQFDNKYTATGAATIAVAKTVNGGTAAKDGEEFEFELLDKDGQKVDGVENVKVKAGKTAEFKALGYTLADAGKTFDYTVHEIAPAAAGWTAANDVNVQVKVTDNGDGTLNCAVSYLGQDKADQAAAAFDNTYAAAPASAAPTVQKTVKTNDGRVWEMKAGQFSFQLKDSAGTVLQTKAVDVNGHVAFDKLSFDKAGRYTYTISEAPVDATKAPNVKRDPTVYSVTYVVDEKNDGTLNARDLEVKSVTVKSSKAVNKPIQGDDADQNLPFVNSETPRTPETPKTPKTPKAPKSGKTPKTGDVTSNTFAVVAGTAGLVLVATTLHRRRRED